MPPNRFESEVESFLEGSHGDRTHIKRADHHTVTPLCGTLLHKPHTEVNNAHLEGHDGLFRLDESVLRAGRTGAPAHTRIRRIHLSTGSRVALPSRESTGIHTVPRPSRFGHHADR